MFHSDTIARRYWYKGTRGYYRIFLPQKDERDVQKTLEDMIQGLNNKSSLAYMKNGDQEIDPEDAELLAASLENVVRQSKLLAKQKFTPKKYRKNQDQ